MKQLIYTIKSNQEIAKNIYKMEVTGSTSAITSPGQFINIKLEGLYLRRPISICDYTKDTITILYKIVGKGTETMSLLKSNDKLDILVGLGNGFDTLKSGDRPILIGGGIGIPPMYNLCKKLILEGKHPKVILGFNSKEEVFYEKEFKDLGVEAFITTVDGSHGIKGFVTDVIEKIEYSYFYTCGPEPMFKAIEKKVNTSGQYSFEERMGCGFGACMGCSCKTITGYKRICKEGPVLEREEILWID